MDNQNQDYEITDEFDKELVNLLLEIEKQTQKLNKHDQLRVKAWCKKLCQVTNNTEWKKNRNLHAICLLDNVLNEHFESPYNKFPPEGAVPMINKTLVKAKLSQKFLKSTITTQNKSIQQSNNNNSSVSDCINNGNHQLNSYQEQMLMQNNKNEIIINNNVNNNNKSNREVEQLKEYIEQIQRESNKKDITIRKLKEDKMKMEKRIQELEKMISSFMEIDK
jgi:hypothetical protein